MNRRGFLMRAGAAGLVAAGFPLGRVRAEEGRKKRILYFTKCSGFVHSVVKRNGEELSHSEKVLLGLAEKNGFEVVCSKDGSLFTPEYLAGFDAYFFMTTGDLTRAGTDGQPPMTAAGKQALLDAVRGGKGFIGAHTATDTFHSPGDRFAGAGEKLDPYLAMVGAEFIKHGPQQSAKMIAVDGTFPGCEGLNGGFELKDEWYTFKDFAPDMHVLLVQETAGMNGSDYQRGPYPATWARMHGKGRVFHTSMGHREDVWTHPTFQKMLLGGIAWALGNVDADVTPNLMQAAPRHAEIQPKPAPKPKPAAPAANPPK